MLTTAHALKKAKRKQKLSFSPLQAYSAFLSHLLTSLTHPLPICKTPVPFHLEGSLKPSHEKKEVKRIWEWLLLMS